MTIYDFSLASYYEPSGVDTAMAYRAKLLQKMGYEVKMIFPTDPWKRDFLLYTGLGIPYNQMTGIHVAFTDLQSYEPKVNVYSKLKELKEILQYTEEEWESDCVSLTKEQILVAKIYLTKDREYFYYIDFYNLNYQIRRECYADYMYECAFVSKDAGKFLEVRHRFFYNHDGSLAFVQNIYENSEINMFPDGSIYNQEQLFEKYVERLHLSKSDIVILDRTMMLFPMKPLFARYTQTNIVCIMHSEHFFSQGKSTEGLYLNREYWYWFKYSKCIHTMLVSTQKQKESIEEILRTYHLQIPRIFVVPVMGVSKLQKMEQSRKRKSIICTSRLNNRKKIDWTIYAAIKAHRIDPEISLDIYGKGVQEYSAYLNEIIQKENATQYIHLKGFADVTEIYKKYELFITTSLGETFGISLLEAVSSGLAMVGFDVEYGNPLFIEDDKNGYLVPYNPAHFQEECPEEIDVLAQKIVDILSNRERVQEFSKHSYEIALRYKSEFIAEKWRALIANILTTNAP